MNNAYIIFDEKTKKQKGKQKFVLIKTLEGFIFASLPLSKAPQHFNIVEQVKREKALEEIEVLGGGYLYLNGKNIILDTSSFSYKYGPIKLAWIHLKKILQIMIGNEYTVNLSDDK